MGITLAERFFSKRGKPDKIIAGLRALGVEFQSISGDNYDNSLELMEVPNAHRLPIEAQKFIFDAGFSKVYVNHLNGWETHYQVWSKDGFCHSSGWRVSYPRRRADKDGPILIEDIPSNWPADWFTSGKAKVVPPQDGT